MATETSTMEQRRAQMLPTLTAGEIARLARFGERRSYPAGAQIYAAGEVTPGLVVLLKGDVAMTRHDPRSAMPPIVVHHAGSFMGELSQLSGRPTLVDGIAETAVDGLVIASHRLRDLMVEEAELGERIMRALILRRVGLLEENVGGPVIIGRARQADVLRLEGFLSRNGHPFQHLDAATDPCAQTLLEKFHLSPLDLPVVLCPNGRILHNPTEHELARCIGLDRPIDAAKIYDVAVVGAGPAGLAAAVYAGSEGLSVIVLDARAFGGQAGASARIENYLGFPTGISGMALMARAYNQAQKFGVEMAIPDKVVALRDAAPGTFEIALSGGEQVKARAVIIASGARYRRLAVDRLSDFEGASVHYWASPLEGRLCSGQPVALVGAGNSAGQAAVYLASQTAKVTMIVRGPGLEATMSRYLIERIAAQPNIELLTRTEVAALEGQDGALEAIHLRSAGKEERRALQHLFLFIGADPNTDWLGGYDVEVDGKGFICAEPAAPSRRPLETSRPGVFAVGDVRSGSVKRIAAAVGEGAQVVAAVHRYLADPKPAVKELVHA